MLKVSYIKYLVVLSFLISFAFTSEQVKVQHSYINQEVILSAYPAKKVPLHSACKKKIVRYFPKKRSKSTEIAFFRIAPPRNNEPVYYYNLFLIDTEKIFTKSSSHIFLKRGPPLV